MKFSTEFEDAVDVMSRLSSKTTNSISINVQNILLNAITAVIPCLKLIIYKVILKYQTIICARKEASNAFKIKLLQWGNQLMIYN